MSTQKIQDTSSTGAAADYDTADHFGVEADSNCQSAATVGEQDRFVTREGGSDAGYQAAQGAGGRELL
jgi:hypothetical protein